MIDRPMKTISLRKFRDSITDITAVTEVSLRDADGNIRILGFWTPYATHPVDAIPLPEPVPGATLTAEISVNDEPVGRGQLVIPVEDDDPDSESGFALIRTPEEAAVAVTPVRPFPKAVQARRKKR